MIDDEKAVHDVFAPIAPTYRAINRALTLGLDGYWRWRAALRALRPQPAALLDVCTGTGDMAHSIRRLGNKSVAIAAVDFSESMLNEAVRRCAGDGIDFRRADAADLPFPDATFDCVTIAFALRNLNVAENRFGLCLRECLRVLRPGGRLITVETTQPPNAAARALLHRYVAAVVPRLGAWWSGSRPAYAYLAHTIPRFYGAPALADILCKAGFDRVDYTYLAFGLAAIHEARKKEASP